MPKMKRFVEHQEAKVIYHWIVGTQCDQDAQMFSKLTEEQRQIIRFNMLTMIKDSAALENIIPLSASS